MPTLLALALAALTLPQVQAQRLPPAQAQLLPPGPVGSVDSLTAFAERAARRPLEWGLSWDPDDAQALRPVLFLVAADSTVWIEDPDGRTVVLDGYVAATVGESVSERIGYAEASREASHMGYGYEGGRVYLYLTQGAHVYAAAGLLLAFVAGTIGLVAWLAGRLRRERRLRSLLDLAHRRTVEAREGERLRIAQELHDGPVQDLNLVNLRLAGFRVAPPSGGGGAGVDVAELRAEVVGVVRELRTISEALRPPALGPFGLAAALRVHAERFESLYSGVRVTCDLDDDGRSLPEGVRLALFRVAQEAMTNAVKHGTPSVVRVTFRLGDVVELAVADDGSGYVVPMDLGAYAADGHFGLAGMAERAEAVGARLEVDSTPGSGTTVRVRVPRNAPGWSSSSMQHKV